MRKTILSLVIIFFIIGAVIWFVDSNGAKSSDRPNNDEIKQYEPDQLVEEFNSVTIDYNPSTEAETPLKGSKDSFQAKITDNITLMGKMNDSNKVHKVMVLADHKKMTDHLSASINALSDILPDASFTIEPADLGNKKTGILVTFENKE